MEQLKKNNIIIEKKQLENYLCYLKQLKKKDENLNQLKKNGGKCATCGTASGLFTCRGCKGNFCTRHVVQHREELEKQMDELMLNHMNFSRI